MLTKYPEMHFTPRMKSVLPLEILTVEETKAPDGYLLDGAYMQAGDSAEQIKGMYLTQITEDGELAVLSEAIRIPYLTR